MLKRGWEVASAARREAEIKSENYSHYRVDLSYIKSFLLVITKSLSGKITEKKFNRIDLVNNAASAGELLRMKNLILKICAIFTL